jgi:hypothetical protein
MARNGWLLVVSTAVSTLVACAHAPEGYRPPASKPDGVRVVAKDAAEKTGLPEWTFRIPLGEKEDASVLEFLALAEAAGARYVSDVEVVFAAEKGGQLLECRTHITPVVGVAQRWLGGNPRRLTRTGGERMVTGYQSTCRPDSAGRLHCVQVPVSTESPTLYAYKQAVDIPVTSPVGYQRQWRLQKSAPECTPQEAGAREAVLAAERVEGRIYGCSDASAGSGCEDKAQ